MAQADYYLMLQLPEQHSAVVPFMLSPSYQSCSGLGCSRVPLRCCV